jgi:prevent-host-death family protein
MKWTIAKARQQFSSLLRRTKSKPQPIYNRSELVAAVISAVEFKEYQDWSTRRKQRSLGAAFADLRKVLEQERSELKVPRRKDRESSIVKALDELSR